MTLTKKLDDLIKKQGELYPPFIATKIGEPLDVICSAICALHKQQPVFVHRGLVKPWVRRPIYIESVEGYESEGRRKKKRGQWKNVAGYLYHQTADRKKSDLHYSTFGHDTKWIDNIKKTGSVSCTNTEAYLYRLFIDVDRDTLEQSVTDAVHICDRLTILDIPHNLWHTGGGGYHIEIPGHIFGHVTDQQERICGRGKLVYNIAHHLAGDVRFGNGIVDPHFTENGKLAKAYYDQFGERVKPAEAKKPLENIDPNLYYVNSTIRRAYSLHEKTGNLKQPVSIDNLTPLNSPKRWPVYPHPDYPPTFLPIMYANIKAKTNPNPLPKHKKIDASTNVVTEILEDYFPDLDPGRANGKGWVDGLRNPLYQDSNPSVGVNIHTGLIKDFGNSDYDMDLPTFISRYEQIPKRKANDIIRQRKADEDVSSKASES